MLTDLAVLQLITLAAVLYSGWLRRAPIFCVYLLLAALGNFDYGYYHHRWIWWAVGLALARIPVIQESLHLVLPTHAWRISATFWLLAAGLLAALWKLEPHHIALSLRRLLQIGEAAWMLGALAVIAATRLWRPGQWSWHAFCLAGDLSSFALVSLLGRLGLISGHWFTIDQAAIAAGMLACVGWLSISLFPPARAALAHSNSSRLSWRI